MLPPNLKRLVADLDLDAVRIRRPTRFVFLCGGAVQAPTEVGRSLRHYLLVHRKIERRLSGKVILAERANQLYRDSGYRDLISFEEDVARIAAVVVVIAESVGSFAELGAFATNETIKNLVVFGQTEYSTAESFLRYGPMERVKKFDTNRLVFYPWRMRRNGTLIKRSVSGHYLRMRQLIDRHLGRAPREQLYRNSSDGLSPFAQLLWLLHLSSAIEITQLHELVRDSFDATLEEVRVKNRLYCMKLAGWVDFYTYESQEYWYATSLVDPFDYSFQSGVTDTDSLRRKSAVTSELKSQLGTPNHVLRYVVGAKRGAAP